MNGKRNYKLIIGLPLLVIAVSALTVFALVKIFPQDNSSSTAVLSPADIIAKVKTNGTISGLDKDYTIPKQSLVSVNTISYTADNSYTIQAPSEVSVQFEQNDKQAPQNSTSVKAALDSFLTKKANLKKATSGTNALPLMTVYDSDTTTCQVFDMPPFGKSGAVLALACVKKSVINDQYASINKLLALYSGTKSDIASPVSIRTNTITQKNMTLTMLDLYGLKTKTGAVTLIFAAIDDKWEYIGQRLISATDATAIVDNSISSELKAKLADPRYNGFLQQYVH